MPTKEFINDPKLCVDDSLGGLLKCSPTLAKVRTPTFVESSLQRSVYDHTSSSPSRPVPRPYLDRLPSPLHRPL